MDEVIIKLECLKLALTGTPEISIQSAQKYFEWVVGKNDKPKRGRPPKTD